MPNYSLKAECFNSGTFDLFRQAQSDAFFHYDDDKGQQALQLLSFLLNEDYEMYRECLRINAAYRSRVKRLRDKVKDMILAYPCSFITFTFTDVVFDATTAKTRKTYVERYLKANFPAYIANIDYGKKNGREHYHAVIGSQSVDLKSWKYGAINIERVRVPKNIEEDKTCLKVAKYISKLTNHAIKETTKRCAIIYSR